MARRYQFVSGHPERFHIISFAGAFHGRTYAAINAGGNEKYLEGFGPRMPGFDQVTLKNDLAADLAAVKKLVGPQTAAIIIAPLQGEGGVRVISPDFLKALRKLCNDNGLLLIFDEIQTGLGRTGKFFAYDWLGFEPDIMTVAKALGGGFPVGAVLATTEAGKGMTAGTHGSTFGGSPLAMAVANAIMDVVNTREFLSQVQQTALRFKQRLAEKGLAPTACDNVVRLLPALIIGDEEISYAIDAIDRACTRLAQVHAPKKGPQSGPRYEITRPRKTY